MDFDTNHPKLIIAAVACDRNGLTNEAAAFSVRLSAFLFGAPRRCIKRWRFGLHGPGGSEHFQKQVAVRKSCGTRRYHGEAILIFLCGRTPPVIFGFALKSNILNTPFLSSRQSMRTSPFIFKACDAATQSSFILTSSFVPSFAGGSLC